MICPKCKSENVTFQAVAEKQRTGIGFFLLFGIFNALKPTKTKTYAVCQNCGYRWLRRPADGWRAAKNTKTNQAAQMEQMLQAPPIPQVVPNASIPAAAVNGNVFFRRSHALYGKDFKVKISVDGGTQEFVLRDGESTQAWLTPGAHVVRFEAHGCAPSTQHIIVNENRFLFDCSLKGGKLTVSVMAV